MGVCGCEQQQHQNRHQNREAYKCILPAADKHALHILPGLPPAPPHSLPLSLPLPTHPNTQHNQQDAKWEFMRAGNKIRFIQAVISGALRLSNRKRADIEADLEAQGFDRMAKSKDVSW